MNQLFTTTYWRTHTIQLTLLIVSILIIAVLKAVQEANTQDVHGDIYIFWSAGVNFIEGNGLYSRIGGAEEFLYPPFAPLVFQLLGLMPFPVAVGVFTFFNFMAWLGLLRLSYLILRYYFPSANLAPALAVGFVATIRYFWHNIIWVNINELVALLSLGGVYLYLRGRQTTALLLLTMATWLKVMPALLILLFFIRKPVPTLLKTIVFSALIFATVLMMRGVNRGYQDYVDFWQITLLPFLQAGKIYTDSISFSLPSMLGKLLTSAGNAYNNHAYNIVDWHVPIVRRISLAAQLLVFGLTFWRAWVSRHLAVVPLSVIVLVYLTMLLVSGVTWEGHFVTMVLTIPATYQLLTVTSQLKTRRVVVWVSVLIGLMIFDTIGPTLYDYSQGFSLLSYLAIGLYGLILRLDTNKRGPATEVTEPRQKQNPVIA
ncbi:glycosyltransferase family 87 protein [Spirosoma rhododendri]|uniref:DUF2029 domain-containing protein n=1 Tax=Spirosoma rhododendri TaxID=2728024 RepID=A0A7L5DN99_9BACT|nr:glycosyltransferase family 87 protein [Spirosoma rhododendri]QJD77938.1 DUF2029 domain-containing protein [Spirosoma rhododendri]